MSNATAARGVVYAADHPRRKQYWVGGSTAATLLAQKVAPALLDRYLAKTGFDAQQTDQEVPVGSRPDNLFDAADGAGRRETDHAAPLGEKRLAAFCRQHGYTGRRPAAELLSRLRSAPPGTTDLTITGALRDSVLALVALLRCLNDGVKTLDASITTRLDEHPDGKIFASLPRSGTINAAQMLAGWGDCRAAYDSADAVAALAGLSPVTKESGKHRAVSFRWACNKRLRQAMTIYADNSRHASPWAAQIYANARAAGKDHPHAIRVLGRAWTRVIYRCWQDRIPYNPELHGAARQQQLSGSAA